MWKIFFVITLLTIHLIDATTINCIVREIERDSFGVVKECKAFNVSSIEPDTKISEVECPENINEVKTLSINNSPNFYYLPKEITTHFSNLIILLITATGLKSISKENLKQFEKLRGLYIFNSELTTLDNDLFKYNSKLERLSIYGNKINSVDADIFKPLQSLTHFSFGASICIKENKIANERREIERVIKIVVEKCQSDRSVGEAFTADVKVNQQGTQKVSKETTTERHGFLA